MADPTKRRVEILKEIARLGKLQKKATEAAAFKWGSAIGTVSYDERARRIARLVSELVGLDETGTSKIA